MTENIGDIEKTSFITLYCHSLDAESEKPILNDKISVSIAKELNKTLIFSDERLDRMLVSGNIDKNLILYVAVRAKKFDEYVTGFFSRYPEGVVVNIGCGLDSRFPRTDNGRGFFYDLDLPDIIKIKSEFFEETERYHFIASSVLDFGWINTVLKHKGPFLFLAEGVFMYLKEADVKMLVLTLQEKFPGCELVCEVFSSKWLKFPLNKLADFKMRKELHLGKDAVFRSGIADSRDMEKWHRGIEFLDEWSFFDSEEVNRGWAGLLKRLGIFRKIQWTVHYLLK